MPFKARLAQAIREEEAKAAQRQLFHIVGPGALVLGYIVFIGALAVRVFKAPELIGPTADVVVYGILGGALSLSLSKRYVADRWLDTWLLIDTVRRENIAKIEGVMARLEADAMEKAAAKQPAAAPAQPDPWMRALAAGQPAEEAALNQQQP